MIPPAQVIAKVWTKATKKADPTLSDIKVLAASCPESRSSGAQIPRKIGTSISPAPCAKAAKKDQSANFDGGTRARNLGCLELIKRYTPKKTTKTPAEILIWFSHSIKTDIKENGSKIRVMDKK
jgi:hypothetical protein